MKHLILFEKFQTIDFSEIAAKAIANLSSYDSIVAAYRNEENISLDIEDDEIIDSEDFKIWMKYDFEFNCERILDVLKSLVDNDQIKIFRQLKVNDDWLNNPTQQLGIYWSYDEKAADTHWGDYSKNHTVTLEALVEFDKIDITNTLLANLNPDIGELEKEVTLFKNTPIQLLHIWKDNVDVKFPKKQYFA